MKEKFNTFQKNINQRSKKKINERMRNRRGNIVHQQQKLSKRKLFQCFNMVFWEEKNYL